MGKKGASRGSTEDIARRNAARGPGPDRDWPGPKQQEIPANSRKPPQRPKDSPPPKDGNPGQ